LRAAVLTMLEQVRPVMLSDILAARTRLAGQALVTPVVACPAGPADKTVPLISSLVDGVITVTLAEVANAIKVMVDNNRVVAEGAGAIPVAAALSGRYEYSRVCAVVSGGNLDSSALATILKGGVP
jgi:hypothetical protein